VNEDWLTPLLPAPASRRRTASSSLFQNNYTGSAGSRE